MNKKQQLYAKWYAEYVLDGYQQDMIDEVKATKTLQEAQDLLVRTLQETNLVNYDQISALYDTSLVDFVEEENCDKKKEYLSTIFGKQLFEDTDDFLSELTEWLNYDSAERIEYSPNEGIEIFAQGLFLTAQNLNVILNRIKELEYSNATYIGPKTRDFDDKAQYMTYLIDKKLAEESDDDDNENFIVASLVDDEIYEQNNNIVNYFKNKHTQDITNDDNKTLELSM